MATKITVSGRTAYRPAGAPKGKYFFTKAKADAWERKSGGSTSTHSKRKPRKTASKDTRGAYSVYYEVDGEHGSMGVRAGSKAEAKGEAEVLFFADTGTLRNFEITDVEVLSPPKRKSASKRKRDYAALAKDETKRTKAYRKKHPAAESDEAETHGYEVVNEVILGWYDQF